MNSMDCTYRERLQILIFEATGTRDVLDIPLDKFEDKSKINFEKVRGSVRLMNGMMKTGKEADTYINKVLNTRLP
jgi:geranylgeranyl pyrophosphate synthase